MSEPVGSLGQHRADLKGVRVPGSPLVDGWSWWTIGWAAYLACSWTWCIGMFLPVLLIRDYGLWGYVAFAVPNVIGAAAMGWLLWRRGHSERMVEVHQLAVKTFSDVTVAFQIYFLLWLIRTASVPATWAIGIAAALMFAASSVVAPRLKAGEKPGPLRFIRAEPLLVVSLLVWFVSAACAAAMIARGDVVLALSSAKAAPGLIWLAPVCAFGFLLCPYLDMTFHLARQYQAAGRARASFALGFGVLFLAMILFTALYAQLFDTTRPTIVWATAGAAVVLVGGHISMQMSFTIAAHADARRRLAGASRGKLRRSATRRGVAIGLLIALVMKALAGGGGRTYAGISWGEIGYRLFMSFYGLVFPAYVWICMVPTWRSPTRPTKRQIAVWLAACAIAGPMYWMGFIERVEWWLGPGLAVVLLARIFIPKPAGATGPGDQEPGEPSGAPVPAPTHPPTLAAGA